MDFDFTTETITPDATGILTIAGTGGLEISVGTTAERPASPVNGTLRYNIDTLLFEGYQNDAWVTFNKITNTDATIYKTVTNDQTATDPGSGKIKWDNVTQINSTQLYMSSVTDLGTDITLYLQAIKIGSIIWIQTQDNSDEYQRWEITSLVNNTGWFTFDVTLLDSHTGQFSNNTSVAVALNIIGSGSVTSVGLSSIGVNSTALTIDSSPVTSSGVITITANLFSATTPGIVSQSAGGTSNFLRADGLWSPVVTSVGLTPPSSGITVAGSPVTTSGSFVLSLANDLLAVENLSTTGIAVRTGTDTWETRTITGSTDQITVTDGNGVASNPVVSISPNPVLSGTESVKIPVGTTAQRPGAPTPGDLRFNTSLNELEIYNNDQWVFFKDSKTMVDEMEPTGFAVRTDSVISFDESTRIFSISPAVTSYTIYNSGTRFIKTTTETIEITNVSGSKYIMFDASGNLVVLSSIQFSGYVFACYMYWDAVSQKATVFADERHGMTMDSATHGYLHNSFGTQYISGLSLNNFSITGTGSLNADATVGITGGVLFDEDLRITIVDDPTPTAQWEQELSPIGKFPIIYKLGSVWTKLAATDYTVKLVTNRIGYNEDVAGNWQITETSTDGYYVAAWVISTNDVRAPVISIMGQSEFATLNEAIEGFQISNLDLTGFPFVEFKSLYRLIYQTDSTYLNTIKARLVNVEDVRAVKISAVSTTTGTDHSQLAGLANDDHLQYVHIANPRLITATHTFNPSSAGAPFILGANATGQLVTGLNADLLDGLSSSAFQLVDADLTALAATTTNGLYVRTGDGASATRAITGTTNQITVVSGDGVSGNPVISISPNPVLPGTGGMVLNSGTTAERPVSPTNGTIRYNTTLGVTEMFQNGSWFTISGTTSGNKGIINIYTGVIPATSGTSTVPWDNTKPTSTEGTQIWTFTVTPTVVSSEFKLTVPFTADCGTSNRIVISSLFRNGINIGSALFFATGGGRPTTTTLSISDAPNTLSPVTYSMRSGVGAGSATWYINSTSTGNNLGGALVSAYQITEVG